MKVYKPTKSLGAAYRRYLILKHSGLRKKSWLTQKYRQISPTTSKWDNQHVTIWTCQRGQGTAYKVVPPPDVLVGLCSPRE